MKTIQLNRLMILVLLLTGQHAFGQTQGIDSLKIIPENPTSTDEIKVICYATFLTGGCDMVNHSVTFQGNLIILNLEHEPGMLTYICQTVDTVSLGNLSPGDYQLHTNLIIQSTNETVDTDNTFFSIDNPLGIDENSRGIDLNVYPNPFDRELQIETNAVIERVEISSVSGQKMSVTGVGSFHKNIIDLSELKNGIYLLTVTDTKGNHSMRRIIKNTPN